MVNCEEKHCAEENNKNCEVSVLLFQEGAGAVLDVCVDLDHTVHAFLGGPGQIGLLRVVLVFLVLINFDFLSSELHFVHHKRVVESPTNAEDRSTEDDEVGV